MIKFSWNKKENNHGIDLYFMPTRIAATTADNAQWTSCCSNEIIDSHLCDYYEYETEIIYWDYIKTCIGLGVADKDIVNENIDIDWSTFIGNSLYGIDAFAVRINGSLHYEDHFSFYDYDDQEYKTLKNRSETEIKFKKNDKIRVGIDFKKKCMKIYYNDNYINSVYHGKMPDQIIFIASLWAAQIRVGRTNYK